MNNPPDNTAEFIRQLAIDSDGAVTTRPVHFLNDDMSRYREKLRRFEEDSRTVVIHVDS